MLREWSGQHNRSSREQHHPGATRGIFFSYRRLQAVRVAISRDRSVKIWHADYDIDDAGPLSRSRLAGWIGTIIARREIVNHEREKSTIRRTHLCGCPIEL